MKYLILTAVFSIGCYTSLSAQEQVKENSTVQTRETIEESKQNSTNTKFNGNEFNPSELKSTKLTAEQRVELKRQLEESKIQIKRGKISIEKREEKLREIKAEGSISTEEYNSKLEKVERAKEKLQYLEERLKETQELLNSPE